MARSRRTRDYKAEYARRVAKGRAAGKTRQQARGHAYEAASGKTEAGYRRERTLQKYGATPSQITKLRKAARDHVLSELGSVKTTHSPKVATIEKGMRMLQADTLEMILNLPAGNLRALAGLDYNEVAEALDEDPDDWPDWAKERNPLWYG